MGIDETRCFIEVTLRSGKEMRIAVRKNTVIDYMISLDEGTHKHEMLMFPGVIIRKDEVISIVSLLEPVFLEDK